MKLRVFKSLSMCAALLFCVFSIAYATQCTIVQSSIPWDQSDQGTWISDTYQLTVECTDNGFPVEWYQAEFNVSLMEGSAWQNKIATLAVYSNPTNSSGIASIIVPLIHVIKNDGKYIHIDPFDDIQYSGGVSIFSQAAPVNSSGVASLTAASTTGCLNTLEGCCETTITVTCCTPNVVFTYCTTTTADSCITGTTSPDLCTTITTTWDPNGTCNYCTGYCEEKQAIALSSFTAAPGSGSVTLNWVTETEIDNAGFNIYRADKKNGEYIQINEALIQAEGSPTQGASYEYIDTSVQNGKKYWYKLQDVDLGGMTVEHGPVKAKLKKILK